jgi:hypothetical protein
MSLIVTRVMCSAVTGVFVLSATACAGASDPAVGEDSAMESAESDGPSTAPQAAHLPHATVSPEVAASLEGTLSCNLEYARFSPTFLTLPQTSFSLPLSVVASQGAQSNTKTLLLYAQINPSPPANLAFEVGTIRISTGKSLSYVVLPTPTLGGQYVFESGAQITTVTIGGIAYDHIRTFCTLTP